MPHYRRGAHDINAAARPRERLKLIAIFSMDDILRCRALARAPPLISDFGRAGVIKKQMPSHTARRHIQPTRHDAQRAFKTWAI